MTVIYHGTRTVNGCRVAIVDGANIRKLPARLDLFNHSPTGFEWGYEGSGPSQLALALLAHVLNDDERAVRLHQRFKRLVIAKLKGDTWELTRDDVLRLVEIIMVTVKQGLEQETE